DNTAVRRGREVRLGRPRRPQCRIVLQDRAFALPQLWPRFDAELVGEQPCRLAVLAEGIALTAAAIERQHQLRAEALPVWVLRNGALDLDDELARIAKG